jgi:transposase
MVIMAKGFRPVNRDQQFLLPVDMREWLPVDHVVWIVLETVAQLDLRGLQARYALGGVGRRAFDPGMLLALMIYAYADGIRSSRQIERMARTDVAMRLICASQVPDHTVIARFRQLHQESVRDLFTQVLLVCAKAGLGRLGTIAIDGTKIAANASRRASCRREWLQQQVDTITAQAAAADAAEDAEFGTGLARDQPARPFRGSDDRHERIKRALAEVIAEEADRGLDAAAVAAREREFLERTRRGDNKVGSKPVGVDRVAVAEARLQAAQNRLAEQVAVKREKIAAMRERIARYEAGQGPKPNLGPFSFDENRGQDVARAQRWVSRAERELAAARQAEDDNTSASAPPQEPADAGVVPGGGRHGARGRSNKDERPQVRRNVTDIDSRTMRGADGGALQGYNAQLAVSDDGLILCPELVQDGNDRRQLQPMSRAVVKAAGQIHRARCTRQCLGGHGCCLELEIHAADAAESSDAPIRGCEQRACPCLTDWIGILLFDNGYWSHANLNAPGPDRLIATGKKRNLPPPGQNPAALPEHADAAARMAHRLATPEGSALYKRRAATVEPVNGHLKDRTALRRFARRGLAACQAELDFAALVLNLRKLWRITADRATVVRTA